MNYEDLVKSVYPDVQICPCSLDPDNIWFYLINIKTAKLLTVGLNSKKEIWRIAWIHIKKEMLEKPKQ